MKQEDKDLLFKDLCGRLPYGVKFQNTHDKTCAIRRLISIQKSIHDNEVYFICGFKQSHLIERPLTSCYKPILHPLSDLTKEIEHKGGKLILLEQMLSVLNKEIEDFHGKGLIPDYWGIFIENMKDETLRKFVEKIYYDKLLEYHFDTNGLIDKGLAIDVNELGENPYK